MGFMEGMANAVPVASRPSSANINRDFDIISGSFHKQLTTYPVTAIMLVKINPNQDRKM
jgi:hypothetical protein